MPTSAQQAYDQRVSVINPVIEGDELPADRAEDYAGHPLLIVINKLLLILIHGFFIEKILNIMVVFSIYIFNIIHHRKQPHNQ